MIKNKHHVDTSDQSPVVLSTCSGIRGLERGLERVIGPLRIACYVEIEAFAIENLVCEMEAGAIPAAPIWSNLKTLPLELFRNRIDWLLGGYPCTPFSLAGKRTGASHPGHLWPYYKRIIKAVRPVFCFFENVDDHLTLGFPEVYESLRSMGYNVEAVICSAEQVGAPHERQRLFILAVANSNSKRQQQPKGCVKDIRKWVSNRSKIVADANDGSFNYKSRVYEEAGPAKRLQKWNNHEKPGKSASVDNSSMSRRSSLRLVGKQGSKEDNGYFQASSTLWPSRPGEVQHQWEHPRIISRPAESHVGIATHGGQRYSFREDFLRAIGNMVVPDAAEIAICQLLQLHELI